MVDVEAEKPDDVVDVENSLRAKLVAQMVVDKEEQDVKHCEQVPPHVGCMRHLRKYFAKLVFLTNTCLVADHISGIFSNARESHVRTLAAQILFDLACKVGIIGEADEAHGQSPYVPLEDLLVCLLRFFHEMAANSELR